MSRTLSLVSISFVLSACASPRPEQSQERKLVQPLAAASTTSATPSPNCSVYVYRNKTSFHAFNPEQPFLYVGEGKVGRLAIGQSHCLRLPPGKHTISVKEPILFMPSYTSGRVEVEVTGDTPIYVRYSKEFSGVVAAGSSTTVTGSSNLQPVSEDQWRARQ